MDMHQPFVGFSPKELVSSEQALSKIVYFFAVYVAEEDSHVHVDLDTLRYAITFPSDYNSERPFHSRTDEGALRHVVLSAIEEIADRFHKPKFASALPKISINDFLASIEERGLKSIYPTQILFSKWVSDGIARHNLIKKPVAPSSAARSGLTCSGAVPT